MSQTLAHGGSADAGLQPLYGISVEFDDPEALVEAARKTRDAGYKRVEGYSPFPIEALSEALGQHQVEVPWLMFGAGIAGGVGGFGLLAVTSAWLYPVNIGGRALIPWAQFIPITFECTVLLAALTGVAAMFVLNGLPEPYHPIFNAPNFDGVSSDRFFLCVEARDKQFDAEATRKFLEGLGGIQVSEVRESKK